ncbi:MAG: phosphatase PAP2 family protein [Acidobacteriota bacterium]
MRAALTELSFQRISQMELPVCRFCHELSGTHVRSFFSLVSRVGDGHYLYLVLGGLLAFLGTGALPVVLHALAAAALCHVLYKGLKNRTARVRPFAFAEEMAEKGFDLTVPPLDKYSFPSGHTLHAVTFSLIVGTHVPTLAWLLVPFAVLVALSRLVLGLHYPTDVLAGAALGASIAFASFQI